MKRKHTPGPYEKEEIGSSSAGDDGVPVFDIIAGGRVRLATVAGEEDANLFSAAPDLLAALAMFVWPHHEGDQHTDTERQEIGRAAIAKAIGSRPA